LFLTFLGLKFFEIQLASSALKIDFRVFDDSSPLVDFPEDIECEDDGAGKVSLEESRGVGLAANGV
jgi:hypothetical protein